MYQNFINYKEEYNYYSNICIKYKSKSILELGCGSGNLASKFAADFESYIGLDLSEDMLTIAKEKFPKGNFKLADMRTFILPIKIDAALITGRSTSYLTTNDDLKNTFTSVAKSLNPNGIFVFDCIDALKFIPYIAKNPTVEHNSLVDNIPYNRKSEWALKEDSTNNLINWTAHYFKADLNNKNIHLGTDESIFKAFTQEEITTKLIKNGFDIISIVDRKSYAFDTFVVIAQKK